MSYQRKAVSGPDVRCLNYRAICHSVRRLISISTPGIIYNHNDIMCHSVKHYPVSNKTFILYPMHIKHVQHHKYSPEKQLHNGISCLGNSCWWSEWLILLLHQNVQQTEAWEMFFLLDLAQCFGNQGLLHRDKINRCITVHFSVTSSCHTHHSSL